MHPSLGAWGPSQQKNEDIDGSLADCPLDVNPVVDVPKRNIPGCKSALWEKQQHPQHLS